MLETLTTVKRTTWALISQHAQVVALDANTLQLGFSTGGLASAFSKGGHSEHVQRALAETLGLQVRVEPVVSDGTAPPTPPTSGAPAQSSPAPANPAQGSPAQASPAPAPGGTSWEPQNSPAAAAPPPQDAAPQSAPPRSASPADEDAGAAKDQPEDTATAAPPWDVDESEEPTAQSVPAQPAPASRGEAGSDAAVDRAADTVADLGSAGEPGPVPPAEEDPAGEPPVEDPADPEQPGPGDADPSTDPTELENPGEPDWPSTDWAGGIDPPEEIPAEQAEPAPTPAPGTPETGTPTHGGPPPTETEPPQPGPAPSAPSPREQAMAAAREAKRTELSSHSPQEPAAEEEAGDYEPPDPNDPTIETTGLIGAPLVARLLGGTVIDEILDSPEGGDR